VLTKFKSWWAFSSEPNVLIAQYGEVKRQVPLLYALLVLNACAVSYTHRAFAPDWLTIGFNGLLVLVCGWRTVAWMLAKDTSEITAQEARAQLIRTTVLAGVLGAAFVAWSLTLDQYGGTMERGHIALFIAVTVIGCIFCLVHLPQAAMLVTAAVTIPYLCYYLYQGNPVFTAMALNIALVTAVMIWVLLNSFAGFETLIRSKETLALKQREAERLGAENARLAYTDALTGLPNRRYFFAELDRALAAAKTSGGRIAVGVFDLDRFKPVNDTYGHVLGDRLLTLVGGRFAEAVSEGVVLARLGGDEFGILLTRDVDDAQAIGQTICDRLSETFVIDDHQIALGCSAGFAIYPDAGATVHELFDRSDYALYHVKSARRGECALFSIEHETLIRTTRAVEIALQSADLDAELHVRYQPIVCTETMAVLGVEALGRWTSPVLGSVSPEQFITTAERIGLIETITLTLFAKALDDFAQMPGVLGLSFNLSAHDIVSPKTVAALIAMVENGPVDAKRLTFELTETALMRDFDAAVRGIRALRTLGIRIALDDFGIGYSSLGYLRRLPLDKVKVDRSFTADIDETSGRTIVTAILGLCQTLELDCIVEGVETEAQLGKLQALGYRMAQGYFFAAPMPLRTFMTWMTRQQTVRTTRSALTDLRIVA
jgi:diguanylate cyclase (GGDEF)-like protein